LVQVLFGLISFHVSGRRMDAATIARLTVGDIT